VGNPHAGFDEAGAGDGLPSTAPALDPTGGRGGSFSLSDPYLGSEVVSQAMFSKLSICSSV
jgi:hypothetical protein